VRLALGVLHPAVTERPGSALAAGRLERSHANRHNLPPVGSACTAAADPKFEMFAERFARGIPARRVPERVPSESDARCRRPPLLPKVDWPGSSSRFRRLAVPRGVFVVCWRRGRRVVRSGRVGMAAANEARLRIMPAADAAEGQVVVAVTTSSDTDGAQAELQRNSDRAGRQPAAFGAAMGGRQPARCPRGILSPVAAERQRSTDRKPVYETLHARRGAYRRDTVPPGLFLPSTVQTTRIGTAITTQLQLPRAVLGRLHGQSLCELGERVFPRHGFLFADRPQDRAGLLRLSAARSYQLSGYPIHADDDPLGVVPIGPHGVHDRLGSVKSVLVAVSVHAGPPTGCAPRATRRCGTPALSTPTFCRRARTVSIMPFPSNQR